MDSSLDSIGTLASADGISLRLAEVVFRRILGDENLRPLKPLSASIGLGDREADALAGIAHRVGIRHIRIDAADQQSPTELETRLAARANLPASDRHDILSMEAGGSPELLAAVEAGSYRPALLHCTNTDRALDWSTREAALTTCGYNVVATSGHSVFLLHPTVFRVDERPTLSTFDVFDTLIARRCVEPWRIFEQVGKAHNLPDFVEKRQIAERSLLPGDYTFDDIYREVGRIYGFDDATTARLQATELALELGNVVPIAENMARVKDGDLLISDMYLSEAAIRSLLAKAGLTKHVGLSVATHGKSAGHIWPKLRDTFVVECHLGDNPHADFAMAQRFGIPAVLTQASTPSLVEQTLATVGLADLARLCREVRLTTTHADPVLRERQIIQASLNFPLLLLASVALARKAEALGSVPLLFCSRDCNLWLPLFEAVQQRMGRHLDTRYFLTSRLARLKGSDDYLAYARRMLGSSAMVVDLCGTGWSLAHLMKRLGLTDRQIFLIDRCPPLASYEAKDPTPGTCQITSLVETPPGVDNAVLELANLADHAMHVDMRALGGTFVPILAPTAETLETRDAVEAQRAVFLHAVSLMRHYALRDALDLDDDSIRVVCLTLYRVLSQQGGAFAADTPRYLAENASIVNKLVA